MRIITKLIVAQNGTHNMLDDKINTYLMHTLTHKRDMVVDIKYVTSTCGSHRAETSACQIMAIERSALVIIRKFK